MVLTFVGNYSTRHPNSTQGIIKEENMDWEFVSYVIFFWLGICFILPIVEDAIKQKKKRR